VKSKIRLSKKADLELGDVGQAIITLHKRGKIHTIVIPANETNPELYLVSRYVQSKIFVPICKYVLPKVRVGIVKLKGMQK
jgi:hypothetical protein